MDLFAWLGQKSSLSPASLERKTNICGFKGFCSFHLSCKPTSLQFFLIRGTESTIHEQQERSNPNKSQHPDISLWKYCRLPRLGLLSPCWPRPCLECVCLLCHSGAVVKTLLNSGWLSQRGQVQLCVYDPGSVRVKLYYVCLCACGAKGRTDACQGCGDKAHCLRSAPSQTFYNINSSDQLIIFLIPVWSYDLHPVTRLTEHTVLLSQRVQIHTHVMECDPERACMNERLPLMTMPAETFWGVLRENRHNGVTLTGSVCLSRVWGENCHDNNNRE